MILLDKPALYRKSLMMKANRAQSARTTAMVTDYVVRIPGKHNHDIVLTYVHCTVTSRSWHTVGLAHGCHDRLSSNLYAFFSIKKTIYKQPVLNLFRN